VIHAKEFLPKRSIKSPDFQEFFSEIAIFRKQAPTGYQNIAGVFNLCTFLSDL
jgi:hypothetical protein